MIQNYSELGVRDDTFFSTLLKYTIEEVDKLSMPWVTILLDSIARSPVDTQIVVDYFVRIAPLLHKKFQRSYQARTAQQNVGMNQASKYDLVPDLTDFAQMWLSL